MGALGARLAGVLFVGEAPGAEEVKAGRPLVGRAGRVFDHLLALAGLRQKALFISNLIKCRPPGNRPPRAPEVAACLPYLWQQVAAVDPQVLVPMGAHALRALAGPQAWLTALHGAPLTHGGRLLFPLFHPAAAFYNESLRQTQRADAQRLGEFLRSQAGPTAATTCFS